MTVASFRKTSERTYGVPQGPPSARHIWVESTRILRGVAQKAGKWWANCSLWSGQDTRGLSGFRRDFMAILGKRENTVWPGDPFKGERGGGRATPWNCGFAEGESESRENCLYPRPSPAYFTSLGTSAFPLPLPLPLSLFPSISLVRTFCES